MSVLRLWSLQAVPAWERLLKTGVLRGDGRRVEARTFRPAYRWLMEQMRERVDDYAGGFPVWAWYRPMPDLRCAGHAAPGAAQVRIELSVDASRVLLSDFDAWHFVLNRGYVTESEEEWEAAETRNCQREMRESWNRIFNVEERPYDEWTGGCRRVQATLGEIRLSDVLSARLFRAR
jgi:hypothetical protein